MAINKAEAELKKELMKKELDAHITVSAVSIIATSTLTFMTTQKRIIIEKDDIIDEVYVEVKNITLRFASLL